MSRRWFTLPYEQNKGSYGSCAMPSGPLYDAQTVGVLLATFCITQRMHGMECPTFGGIFPC
jgi:hypothetical protein